MDRKGRLRNQLPTNLPQLQNLIKRDSSLYKDEFLQQYQHYQALLQLFLINPAQQSKKLEELVMFLSQICCCYPDDMASFPDDLQSLLRKHAPILDPIVRLALCRGLILMRNKSFIQPQSLLELFFELFRCQDKVLRMTLYNHIVSDIKRINAKHKNNKVNRGLQSFMYTMLADSSPMAARMSLDIMTEMYKKNIWNDARTVNVISTACFSPISRIVVSALKFFLTGESEEESDSENSDSEEESVAMRRLIVSKQVTKRGRKQDRKMAKALAVIKKHHKKRKTPRQATFSALHLLNDPQDFAEKLFKALEKTREKFEVRLMMMSLISRLIGLHQLFVFNYYPYIQRYLLPHQRQVTRILTFFAQACHELIPPEVIEATLKAVVHNFVSERNSSEVIVIGLNTIREVSVRCPLVMDEDLLRDLTGYKNYKDKGVMMAARSLIQLFRTIKPEMLHRKDRGKPSEQSSSLTQKDYGQLQAAEFIPGTELVDLPSDEADASYHSDSNVDDSDGEWVTVHHSSDEQDSDDNDIHDRSVTKQQCDSDDFIEEESNLSEWGSASEYDSSQELDSDGGPSFVEDKMGDSEGSTNQMKSVKTTKRKNKKAGKLRPPLPDATETSQLPKEVLEKVKKQRIERASALAQSRLLTQEEFQKIRVKQLSSQLAPKRGVKRQLQELLEQQEERREGNGELLPEAAIDTLDHIKRRTNKKAKVESIMSGREDREKFGSKRRKLNPNSSTTNKQKAKKKAFMMQKQKRNVRTKSKKSFREKQMALRNSLTKQRRHK